MTIAAFNKQTTEIEKKILDITNLATRTALRIKAAEIEKIPDITDFITAPEFKRSITIHFDAKMKAEANSLASKSKANTALDMADKNRKK